MYDRFFVWDILTATLSRGLLGHDIVTKVAINKKVLLRERKKHTARRVASARYAALSPNGGGGYPHPVTMGRTLG